MNCQLPPAAQGAGCVLSPPLHVDGGVHAKARRVFDGDLQWWTRHAHVCVLCAKRCTCACALGHATVATKIARGSAHTSQHSQQMQAVGGARVGQRVHKEGAASTARAPRVCQRPGQARPCAYRIHQHAEGRRAFETEVVPLGEM